MKVAILKYSAGNVASVENALKRLGAETIVTDSAEDISKADRVILPGVGEASTAMNWLHARKMENVFKNLSQPVLGICLGMQLMGKFSDEGAAECLGIFDFSVKRFEKISGKVPHMGWDEITNLKGRLFDGIRNESWVYFAHSYYVPKISEASALTDYGIEFSAAIQQANFFGVQFHPELSGEAGERVLENFLKMEQ
jgi:glutamine amidotransferase